MTGLENMNHVTIKYSQDVDFPYDGLRSIA